MTLPRTRNPSVTPLQADGQSIPSAISLAVPETVGHAPVAEDSSRGVEHLAQPEHFSAIGKMAASIVHDFKGPLTVIRGCAELLANPEINAEKRQRYSDMILADVNRFLSMSQDLLDYSRGAINLDSRPVQLGDWLEKLTDYVKEGMCAANIRLNTAFNFIGEVKMDEARVWRAVLNLVGNAIDAMPEGGTLTIASEMAEGKWRISVSDTGGGIPVEVRSRIFEPFVTQGKNCGTGLGLAIAWEIVEGHGGSLNFETRTSNEANGSRPGTTFVIELPLSWAPAPARQ